MTNNEKFDFLFQKLLTFSYEMNWDMNRSSRVALGREYLRRAALWTKAIQYSKGWPFIDFAKQIDPTVSIEPEQLELLYSHLRKFFVIGSITNITNILVYALHWQKLETIPFDLPDPYEPVILIYERGGLFGSHDGGYVDVGGGYFPKGKPDDFYSLTPKIELTKEALDAIDFPNEKP